MATSNILKFGGDVGANVLTDSVYLADSQRGLGNQPGIARATLVNKAALQASIVAAGLGQFVANRQATNVTDAMSPTDLETAIQGAIASHSSLPITIGPAATSWWRKESDGLITQVIAGITVPPSGGVVAVTFPIAFTTALLDIQVSVLNAADQMMGWRNTTLTGLQISSGSSESAARTVNITVRGY